MLMCLPSASNELIIGAIYCVRVIIAGQSSSETTLFATDINAVNNFTPTPQINHCLI